MKIIKFLQNLKHITWRYRRILQSSKNRILNKTDYRRWTSKNSFYEDWNERSELLSSYIPAKSKILEFGAGSLVLEKMLPLGCKYYHSDIVQRRHDTIVMDLNENLIILPKVDIIVFSGVLEYVKNIKKTLTYCSNFTKTILFSYALLEDFNSIKERRFHGWVSDLNHQDFLYISEDLNGKLARVGKWKNQTLYKIDFC